MRGLFGENMEQPTEFLTKDELADLTGYRQKKRQI
ncbi:DUF4224 domain-containing protein, partial [Mannheimia haemolytica]